MSTSGDSCMDLQLRLVSSKLVPLFDEMEAIRFPMSILEKNVQRLKKGSPDVGFLIYAFIYHKFQELFASRRVRLEKYFEKDRVVHREGFAKDFFQSLQDIIQHDPALPSYQYSCPGHPLAKVEEIVQVTRRLRALAQEGTQVEGDAAPKSRDLHKPSKPADRLARGFNVAESFSSNKSLRGSISEVALIRPANVAPVDIPWQAVREKRDPSAEQDASDSDDEQSPDEGIRSWNTSSIIPEPVLSGSSPGHRKTSSVNASPERKEHIARSRSTFSMERYSSDAEAALRKLDQIEVLQDSKLRSIENRLMRMEYDFINSNTRLERTLDTRLNDHEIRIQHLENGPLTQSEERTRKLSVFDAGVGVPAGTGVMERQRSQSGYSHSMGSDTRHRSFSRDTGAAVEKTGSAEQRDSLVPSRHASIPRSQADDKERKDSRLSSAYAGSGNEESRQAHRLSRDLLRDRVSSIHHSVDDHTQADTAEVPHTRTTTSEANPGSSFFQDHTASSTSHQHDTQKSDAHAHGLREPHNSRRQSSASQNVPDATRSASLIAQDLIRKSSSAHSFEQGSQRLESRALRVSHETKRESPRESSTDSHAGIQADDQARDRKESSEHLRQISSHAYRSGQGNGFPEKTDDGQDMSRFRSDVLAQTQHRERRHRSVGPRQERRLTVSREEQNGDALVDLNERIQLRLRERIKTAEDTVQQGPRKRLETAKQDRGSPEFAAVSPTCVFAILTSLC